MNPVSLNARGIFPVESKPAEILDYDIIFFGGSGMACAEPNVGKSFHGVVHKVSEDQMKILDKIEFVYGRVPSKAKLYDGNILDCSVYADTVGKIDRSNDKPPTERYIQIMTDGAKFYGVNQDYIDWLLNHENQPRKKPEDLNSYPLPENAPTWTMEEVLKGNGLDGAPIYTLLNGKVFEYVLPEDYKNREERHKWARENLSGIHREIKMNQMLYDPKYGIKESVADMTPEHRAVIEDVIYGYDRDVPKLSRAIAKFMSEC